MALNPLKERSGGWGTSPAPCPTPASPVPLTHGNVLKLRGPTDLSLLPFISETMSSKFEGPRWQAGVEHTGPQLRGRGPTSDLAMHCNARWPTGGGGAPGPGPGRRLIPPPTPLKVTGKWEGVGVRPIAMPPPPPCELAP